MTFNIINNGDPGLAAPVMQNFRHVNYGSALLPVDSSGAGANNTIDLGSTAYGFKNFYIVGTIDLGTNTIADTVLTGVWTFNSTVTTTLNGSGNTKLKISSTGDTPVTGVFIVGDEGGANEQGWQIQTDGAATQHLKFRDSTAGGELLFFEAGATGTGLYVQNDGSLGVHKTSPFSGTSFTGIDILGGVSASVRVAGSSAAYYHLYDTGGTANERICDITHGAGLTKIRAITDAYAVGHEFIRFDHTSAASYLTSILGKTYISGDVGIGTDSPGSQLEIKETSGNLTLTLNNDSHGDNCRIYFQAEDAAGSAESCIFAFDPDATVAGLSSSTPLLATALHVGPNYGSTYVTISILSTFVLMAGGASLSATDSGGDSVISNTTHGSASRTYYIGNQTITTSSDSRYKKEIIDTKINALELINKIRLVDFTWDDPTETCWNNRNARGRWTGFLAQELVNIIPAAVNAPRDEKTLGIDWESDSRWNIENSAIIPIILKAIQELKKENAELKEKIKI